MKIRFRGDIKKFQKDGMRRVRAAQKVAGRAIAEGVLKEVLDRVPKGEKWLDLYREALRYLESPDGERWAVAGVSPTKLTTVPADATQIKFPDGGGSLVDIVRPFIWTVDTLPAISGGWPGNVVVRPASTLEVNKHRETVRPELPRIIEQLQNAGANVIDGFPVVNGQVLMDLKFLQLRLEHGLGGFPRVPHWKPAARQAANKAEEWVNAKKAEIEDAMEKGKVNDPEHTMEPGLEKLLELVRDTSWT